MGDLVDSRGRRLASDTGNGSGLTARQLQSLLGALEDSLAEDGLSVREALDELAEPGWVKLAEQAPWGQHEQSRQATVRRARAYYYGDGPAKHIIRLWCAFTILKGLKTKSITTRGKRVLRKFWRGTANRYHFGLEGQLRTCARHAVDGEVAWAIGWPDNRSILRVRQIDPLQFAKVQTNPDDESEIWYYLRRLRADDRSEKKIAYRDVYCPDEAEGPEDGYTLEDNARVRLVGIDTLGLRGQSVLATVLDWSRAHRKFMDCRVAITRALARFAWKEKIRGGPAEVQKRIAELRSSLTQTTGTGETNPPPATASTRVENYGAQLDPIRVDTGAGNAQTDSAMLLTMIGMGPGVFPHYLGSGESFRLATATQMELPMQRLFEMFGAVHIGMYDELFDLAIAEEAGRPFGDVDGDEREIQVESTALLKKDLARVMGGLAKILIQIPALSDDDAVREWVLNQLEVPDAAAIVERMRKAAEQQAKEQPPALPPGDQGEDEESTADVRNQAVELAIAGMRAFSDSIRGGGD